MLVKILNTGLMHRCFIREKNNMKYILFLFTFALLACETFDDCPVEINKEFIYVYFFTDIDTVISSENFVYRPEYHYFASEKKDLGSDPVPLSIIARGDTLNYALEIKNQENVIILVDSSNTPCASDSILYKRGHNHYRVDAEKIHSCVFYLYQSCD